MERFSMFMIGLSRAIESREPAGVYPEGMLRAIRNRMTRVRMVIQALLAAFQAGTLRTRRSAAAGGARGRPTVRATAAFRLPGQFGWLFAYVPHGLMPNGWLQQLVDDPEMRALLAASPRAVRTLKPLCRMLGVEMPKPAPVAEVPPAPPAGAPAADDGRAGWDMRGTAGKRPKRLPWRDDDEASQNCA
jgi:hypothetical protein